MSHFICAFCGKKVDFLAPGTKNRNHCLFCLYSLHVDDTSGDRRSGCGGLMEPIGKFYKSDGEEMLVHRCQKCGFVRWNRVAGDDSLELIEKLPVVEDPRDS
ncbi:MAG: RNHCP domain-containing protein [Patescibacteria group bacterium]